MKKYLTLLTMLVIFAAIGNAQVKNGKVSGKVIDGNTKTVEAATITLLKAKDSSVAKITAADKEGHFAFENVDEGKYIVSITAVGHTKGFSETFEIASSNSIVTLK